MIEDEDLDLEDSGSEQQPGCNGIGCGCVLGLTLLAWIVIAVVIYLCN
jgi:hypothetical protein